MLTINRVDKTFNKGKKNQIHVIDNTTLHMEDKGLIALLGPSGCGKTTLLNVIGGLDAPNSGDVYIDNKRITRRRSGKVDSIRTLSIGYIFQNYNLVENMTVFENVAIALRMIGVKNQAEIEEKVNYVLQKTGMYRYRSRTAEMLSGGERQRVGIARAIVKNPAIIIADEPTGNLDSKNTIEVMNIIKTISREKLVILVTHEEKLAQFYADRIIRLRDGKVVSDQVNEGTDGLDYRLDNKVYLKDIEEHHRLSNENFNLNFYSDSQRKLNLDIVIKEGSILIRNNDPESRLEIVDDDSPIDLVDDHYRKMSEEDEEATNFQLSKLETKGKRRYKSIMGPIKMIANGFRTVADYGILKKILLGGFVISAMFVTYAICSIFATLNITDDMFVQMDKNYLTITSKNNKVEEYVGYQNNENVDYVIPGNSLVNLNFKYDSYLQTSEAYVTLSGSLSDVEQLDSADLKYGNLPKSNKEIVVDNLAIKNVIRDQGTKEIGLGKAKDFIGCNVEIENMGKFQIVGITDKESPCIYADRNQFIDIIANSDTENEYDGGLINYGLMTSKVKKVQGSWPENTYEVMVNEMHKDDMKIGKNISTKVNGKKLKVVGYFKDGNDSDIMLVNKTTIEYKLVRSMPGVTISPSDSMKRAVLKEIRDGNVNIVDSYENSRSEYLKQKSAYSKASIILAVVILAISCIEIFIIMRASFLSRVKEIGIFRAIGVKKGDIYRMFIGEIIAITTMTSIPGFLFMIYILHRLSKMSYFQSSFLVNSTVVITCLVVLYLVNIVFGLVPVLRTLRARPAEILSRTDVN